MQQHVEKGNDDGLFISSVACCQDLWALIMDAGTGFAQQVYDLSNQVWKGWEAVRVGMNMQVRVRPPRMLVCPCAAVPVVVPRLLL